MSMKVWTLSILLLASLNASTQYYYADVIGTAEINKQQAAYKANKVKTITATGSDRNGTRTNDFSEYHEVKDNGATLRVVKITGLVKTVTVYRFNNTGKVVSIIDSTEAVQNNSTYEYDNAGRIIKVQNKVTDASGSFNQTEVHSWFYNTKGVPEKMWRTFDGVNNKDSLEARFILDENENVGEEKTYKRGKETGFLYYYYNDKKQLTDIVRYNTKSKKLIADIMFEYDERGNNIQKLTTTSSQNLGYLIWRYVFNETGLKTKEALFNKNKQLTGKIDYNYTFGK